MTISRIQNVTLALVSALLSIGVIEGCLQMAGRPSPVVSGWASCKADARTNRLGLRGRTIAYRDNDYVIVLLGDSQVEATACPFDGMPEARLEHHFERSKGGGVDVRVFSVGAGGYGQDQQLLMLQQYFRRFRADLVVLWQSPSNDVWNNMFPTHWPRNGRPKPTFRLINGELHGPSESFGEELWWSRVKLLSLLNNAFGFIDRDGDWERYLPQAYRPMVTFGGTACRDWQDRRDGGYGGGSACP